jgi:hypothetical protein
MDFFEYYDDVDKNILRISLCHIRMMCKIFCHMYMDESQKMNEKFG